MWKNISSDQDLKYALDETKNFPTFLIPYHTIENKLLKRFPEASYTVLLHENPSGDKLWAIVRENPWTATWIVMGCELDANFDRKSLFDAFGEIPQYYSEIFQERTITIAPRCICDLFKSWTQAAFPQFHDEIVYYTTHLYYMTDEQKKKILDLEINLPEGYRFAEVDFEKDPEIINSTWIHNRAGDMDLTKAKLRNMPNTVIKDTENNPVSFEMTDLSSLFNHLYTLPDHRAKGLGNATERNLAKKCIKLGITPCKTVELWNTEVLKSSNRSPYWTRWDDGNEPVEYVFMVQDCTKRLEGKKNVIENGC